MATSSPSQWLPPPFCSVFTANMSPAPNSSFSFCVFHFPGHSSFVWLNSSNRTKLYSFDIGEHNYTRRAVQQLQSLFPERLHMQYGDSRTSIPEFQELYPDVTCDLIVIDGGHYKDVPQKDLRNFRRLASFYHLIVLDDQPGPSYFKDSIDLMWNTAIRRGKVKELFVCMNDKSIATLDREKGITLGRYLWTILRSLYQFLRSRTVFSCVSLWLRCSCCCFSELRKSRNSCTSPVFSAHVCECVGGCQKSFLPSLLR